MYSSLVRRLVLPISLLVLAISLPVLLLSCRKKEAATAEVKPAEVDKSELSAYAPKDAIHPAPPCDEAPPAEATHLGDGVTSYNYYFIAEELQRRPGSLEQTREIERRQAEAQASSGSSILKPPSANVVESEFSHLLGAVAKSNGGLGAAVFDKHGLKIGASGLQMEAMVLARERQDALAAIGASDASHVQRYTCEQLAALAKNCDPKATQGISCWDLEAVSRDCRGTIAAHYRPLFSDDEKVLGASMLVVRERPPCAATQAR